MRNVCYICNEFQLSGALKAWVSHPGEQAPGSVQNSSKMHQEPPQIPLCTSDSCSVMHLTWATLRQSALSF